MIVKLKISDITIPQGLLPRVLTGTVQEVVERYKEAYELGEQLPPIKVWKRDSQYWLIDGVHRLQAHKLLDREYIEAELVECRDELDFRIRAITENIKHGLSLSAEEIKENARLLFKAGLKDVKEIAKILKRTERAVYYYLEDLIEEEKEALRKQVLELRDSGMRQKEIAERLGLSERHVRNLLSEAEKIEKISKISCSLPPTKEAIKLFSEFLETRGTISVDDWVNFVIETEKKKGIVIEGRPEAFLSGLAGEVRAVIEKYAEDDWEIVEKALQNISWVKELSGLARKNFLQQRKKYWERIREELEEKRRKEALILQRAEEVLRDHTYIFSNWNNLAHHLRSSYQDFAQITESEIRDVLIKHSDRLIAIYEEIPELTEEKWEQIADRKMEYSEAVEVAKGYGRRLPYAIWNIWHTKQETQLTSTHLPSSQLAGSQPALSEEEEDEWVKGWEEAWREEQERKKQEKQEQEKQEKKEFRPIPPEEELERLAGDIYRIVANVMEKYPEYLESWWEEIEREVRDVIKIRKRSQQ